MRYFLVLLSLLFLPFTPSAQRIENLVFEGAGIRGIAYCGALMELDERHLLQGVKRVGGTSSGAITAALLSVGYTPQEIYTLIGETNFGKFNDGFGFFVGGFIRMKNRLGYYKGDAFQEWLEELIEKKTGQKNITFLELQQRAASSSNFKELAVTATSLNYQQALYFHAETYPNMRIVDAVRASMAVPYYFEPVIIDEHGTRIANKKRKPEHHVLVDGGFVSNFPIFVFDLPPFCDASGTDAPRPCIARTMGFRIDPMEQIINDQGSRELVKMHAGSLSGYSAAFFTVIKETLNRQMLIEEDWARTVSISDGRIGPKVKRLSEKEKMRLVNEGRKGVIQYLGPR
jgi:NTE family protein